MLDNVVLDSCIIAAIFFPEAISERAIEIVENHDCTTVDLAYIEVANVAWKRFVIPARTRISSDPCWPILRHLSGKPAVWCRLVT